MGEAIFRVPGACAAFLNDTDFWIRNSCEILKHLSEDWDRLRDALLPREGDIALVSLTRQISDPHREGRGVAVLTFSVAAKDPGSSARSIKLVYKPRAVRVEAQFQNLLGWCNRLASVAAQDRWEPAEESVPPLPFRLTAVVDSGRHGWVEFIEQQPCRSMQELRDFYTRQGANLALLYALGGADIHQDNLIACGEHPVLVDLEVLFSHEPDQPWDGRASTRALHHLANSVVNIGLLPHRIWGDDKTAGVDVSGLGEVGEQMTPEPMPMWDEIGTDAMRQVKQRQPLRTSCNLPYLHGEPVAASGYSDEVVRGFENMYRFLCTHRQALLDDSGPLVPFAQMTTRHVLRPTELYARILRDGDHPDNLRDALDREQLLDALWPMSRAEKCLHALIVAEKEDLRVGDVPIFTTRPASRHLWDSRGAVDENFFAADAWSKARERIDQMSMSAMSAQVWLIRSAFAGSASGHIHEGVSSSPAAEDPEQHRWHPPVSTLELVEQALSIGKRLCEEAFLGDSDATWLGQTQVAGNHLEVRPVDGSLYEGDAGIAVFLACLGRTTGNERFMEPARRVARGLIDSLAKGGEPGIGGYTGVTSQLYALVQLAHWLDDASLLTKAAPVLSGLKERIDRGRMLRCHRRQRRCHWRVARVPRSERGSRCAGCGDALRVPSFEARDSDGLRCRLDIDTERSTLARFFARQCGHRMGADCAGERCPGRFPMERLRGIVRRTRGCSAGLRAFLLRRCEPQLAGLSQRDRPEPRARLHVGLVSRRTGRGVGEAAERGAGHQR